MERLKRVGTLKRLSASDVGFSRLGIGFEKLDREVFAPEKAYDKVSAIGVKHARIQSGWMRTEKEKGVYDFEWIDKIADNLLSRGMKPWICLCYGNPLYTPLASLIFGGVGCPPINSEEATEAWLAYVKATVKHFKDRVELFEIWNEPDIAYSWKHYDGEVRTDEILDTNAREYGEFAIKTAIAIKEANPKAKVAGFALGHPKTLKYTNIALSTGLYKHLDYITYHSYAASDSTRESTIRKYRRIVDMYNPNIKLIQGESGTQSRSDGNGALKRMAWTKEKQMKYLLRILVTDLYLGVEFTSYFSCMDMIEGLNGRVDNKASYLDYGYFGVLSAEFDENGRATGDYSEKPSYYALCALASLMNGDIKPISIPYTLDDLPCRRINGRDFADDSMRFYPFELDDGRHAIIYWNPVNLLTLTYEGTTSMTVYGQDNSEIKIVDLRDGGIYSLPEEMVHDLGNGGLLLEHIPLTDTPLAIVFGKENN